MGWTTDLLVGIAEHLDGHSVALWEPSGTYPTGSGLPVVVFRQLPAAPDRALAIAAYLDTDGDGAAGLSDTTVAVQIRCRGTTDPTSVDDISDAIWGLLHGAHGLVLGSPGSQVHTTLIHRRSTALLGVDESGRWERADNYYVLASRSNAWRPD